MTQKVRQPWMPAEWEPADVSAVQALNRGDASPDAQRRALKWIIERVAMTYDQSFVPGQPDVTQFIEGKRSVGNQIVKLLKLDLAAIKKK